MIISPYQAATGMRLWLADAHSEEEIRRALAFGYIEWEGVMLEIEKVQDWAPSAPGLVTKLIQVRMPEEKLAELNDLMIADRTGR